jgi:hypothetical protein
MFVFKPVSNAWDLMSVYDEADERPPHNLHSLKSIVVQHASQDRKHIYQPLATHIWANYNDLTATSLESWLIRGIIPQSPYFRLVNFNLPRYMPTANLTSVYLIYTHQHICPLKASTCRSMQSGVQDLRQQLLQAETDRKASMARWSGWNKWIYISSSYGCLGIENWDIIQKWWLKWQLLHEFWRFIYPLWGCNHQWWGSRSYMVDWTRHMNHICFS